MAQEAPFDVYILWFCDSDVVAGLKPFWLHQLYWFTFADLGLVQWCTSFDNMIVSLYPNTELHIFQYDIACYISWNKDAKSHHLSKYWIKTLTHISHTIFFWANQMEEGTEFMTHTQPVEGPRFHPQLVFSWKSRCETVAETLESCCQSELKILIAIYWWTDSIWGSFLCQLA